MEEINDLIIIGTGPAGLTSSIYASCFHLKHILIGLQLGGQMRYAPDILNYPGFMEISGKELTEKMSEQVKKRGGEIVEGEVVKILNNKFETSNESEFKIETKDGKEYLAKAIILATGTERRKLNIPGEVEYTGRGVHYCATCEKQDYKGKICAVVGGGNSAVQAAVELAQAAKKVYVIYRGTELRGDAVWIDEINKNKGIEVIYETEIEEIIGDGEKMTGVRFKEQNRGEVKGERLEENNIELKKIHYSEEEKINKKELEVDKVFIEIGGVPGTSLVIPLGVEMDGGGYIKVNTRLATNIPGIFAAGDLVSYGLSIEQISSAIGLGARAASSAFMYLKKEKSPTLWGVSQIKR